ncbi:hypothetical protein DCAR_0414905 [Daucus carota subsp. sativus]|uniref:Uncharacterized protein n=1 Tax=Daucus carota subsp. sativus TaxID=79200 RepID=A0A165A381_DAUCS|nr:hypothetical protein DCAR_0414905 [Daucus carota subsp. sativus]
MSKHEVSVLIDPCKESGRPSVGLIIHRVAVHRVRRCPVRLIGSIVRCVRGIDNMIRSDKANRGLPSQERCLKDQRGVQGVMPRKWGRHLEVERSYISGGLHT